jgi:hypothetical protein
MDEHDFSNALRALIEREADDPESVFFGYNVSYLGGSSAGLRFSTDDGETEFVCTVVELSE